MRRLLSIGVGRVHALLAIAAAAAVAAVVIGLSGLSGAPGLVGRADAAVNVRDQVLHEVDVSVYPHPGRYGALYDREEGWLLPADGQARAIDIEGHERAPWTTTINEWIITAKARVFSRSCEADLWCHTGSFLESGSRWHYEGTERSVRGLGAGLFPGSLPGQYAQRFRAADRVHATVPKGITRFAGKRVKSFRSMETGRYEPSRGVVWVYWRPGTPPPARVLNAHGPGVPIYQFYILVDWYIDPATAQLVGLETWSCAADDIRACNARRAPGGITRIAFQRLDPTPQNLAQLTGPYPPGHGG